jgi:hypothetical protein
MPIRDQALAASQNAHLALSGQATLRQAFAALASPEIGGQAWWHLVVARTDGTWAVARFADLAARAQADAGKLDLCLDELEWLAPAQAIEQESVGTGEAQDAARAVPGKLLVVTREGELTGILYVGVERGSLPASTSTLVELAGEHADLSRFSHLLIRKHGPKEKKRTADS